MTKMRKPGDVNGAAVDFVACPRCDQKLLLTTRAPDTVIHRIIPANNFEEI